MTKTKGGRLMNPTDAFRKEQRKREVNRNKMERKFQREAHSKKETTDSIKSQLQEIIELEENGPLPKNLRLKKKVLQDAYDQALKRKKEEEVKKKQEASALQGMRPEDSRYYHPTLNPTGAPPPSKLVAGASTLQVPIPQAAAVKPSIPIPKPPPLPPGPAPGYGSHLPPPPEAPPLPPAPHPSQLIAASFVLPPPPGPPPPSLAPLPPPTMPPPGVRRDADDDEDLQPPGVGPGPSAPGMPPSIPLPRPPGPPPPGMFLPPPPGPPPGVLPPPPGPPPVHHLPPSLPPPPSFGPAAPLPAPPGPPPGLPPAASSSAAATGPQASAADSKKPSTITGASTVVKRPLAQNDKTITSMVPASVRIKREEVKARPLRPLHRADDSSSGYGLAPLQKSAITSAPKVGGEAEGGSKASMDDKYLEFLHNMQELGAFK